jgi:hypothetical protein
LFLIDQRQSGASKVALSSVTVAVRETATLMVRTRGGPGATGAGTITANSNRRANFAISGGNTAAPSNIDGLVTWGGVGNGMNIGSGSNVVVRNSVSVKNANAGVIITPSLAGTLANINLGNATTPGNNVFQAPMNGNTGAGICLGNFFNTMQSLSARGNHFANKSCAALTAPATQVTGSRMGCTGGVDVGIEPSFGNPQANVTVDLAACANF